MKVMRYDNGDIPNLDIYIIPEEEDIRAIVSRFGKTDDVIEVYNSDGELVARAIWPQGSKCYMYSYGKNLDPNPNWCKYIY